MRVLTGSDVLSTPSDDTRRGSRLEPSEHYHESQGLTGEEGCTYLKVVPRMAPISFL